MLDNGYAGDEIFIKIDDNNTTFDFTGTNLKGHNGVDWSPSQGDALKAYYDGLYWYCQCMDN